MKLLDWQTYALGSALFAALTAICAKASVVQLNSNQATLIRTIVILVITGLVVAWRQEWEPIQNLPGRALLLLVVSGIATGLSWLCYFKALQLGPASRVAPVDKLSVVFVILLAYFFFGEPLTPKVLLGGGLILAGSLIMALP